VFRTYADLFALVESQSFEAAALRALQQRLTAGHLRADQQLRRLGRRMPLADFRMFLLFAPIQWLTLWTFHVLWLLERWQRDAGASVRRWLDALGEFEALAAFATALHDHPDWSLPQIVEDGEAVLRAEQLGHPLLPPATVVRNDLQVGPPGTFLLVTGSNMSGKSTLLRAIGVNVALAQAGAPVCATRMSLPPVEIATCMRVQDSLEQGVSYFMAELQRLKLVVDRARAVRGSCGRTLLYLLDEILHGTNTAERQVAARQVIRHLIDLGAIGAVSTHDLTLADAPDLAAARRAVHFTEQFVRGPDGPRMSFDYRLRPGLATSTNALRLMEIVGLPVFAVELPSSQ
jgi:DNA mismatch repair ATPase MutS